MSSSAFWGSLYDRTCGVDAGAFQCDAHSICLETHLNPGFGFGHFDNIGSAVVTNMQLITLDRWVLISGYAEDSTTAGAPLYFIGSIFVAYP